MCRHSPSNDGGHQKSSFCQEKLNLIFNFFYPAIFSTFTKVLIMLFRPSFSSSAKSYETKRQLLSTTKSFCVQYESHFMKIKTISQNCFLRTFCYFAPKTSQGKMNLTCKMVVNDRLQNQFRIFFSTELDHSLLFHQQRFLVTRNNMSHVKNARHSRYSFVNNVMDKVDEGKS